MVGTMAIEAAVFSQDSVGAFRYDFNAMTTRCELQFFGVTPAFGEELACAIENRVAELVRRFNFHTPDSWLNRCVNNRRSNRVELDRETAEILACVREHSVLAEGAFDISVGTLAMRLRQARTPKEVAEIRRQLLPYVGLDRWWLEAHTLCFDNFHTRFDLGGVIKEYAVDVSAHMARAAGVSSALLNYGGDLYAIGRKSEGQRFVVSIVNPLMPETMLFGLDLEDQALTTSAHYARNRLLKPEKQQPAKQLSHIVGATADTSRWISATVVSASVLVSGIYSTALLLKDSVPMPPNVTAVAVDDQGQIRIVTGARFPAPDQVNELARMN
jgi:FAD:protein FMN transferase